MKACLMLHCYLAVFWLGDSFTITDPTISRRRHCIKEHTPATNQVILLSNSRVSKAVSRLYNSKDDRKNNDEHEDAVNNDDSKERKKEEIGKAAARIIKRSDDSDEENASSFNLNPFRAGQNLRKSFDSAITSLARVSSTPEDRLRKNSAYYLDDRFQESGGALFTQESNPYLARLQEEKYIPEVLVVGATGEVGRLVVRRLLLEGRSQVRVLVRDLYSKTLNTLGTGVTYCQGDLNNMDSLEYALTDVDKIVVCAAAPRPDEEGFKDKFRSFLKDNILLDGNEVVLEEIESSQDKKREANIDDDTDMEWERLESVMEVRAKLAEQIDLIGIQNLVKAYQNVRHADYGTSQAAKRSLFKFQSRADDFNLFAIDDEESERAPNDTSSSNKNDNTQRSKSQIEAKSQSNEPKHEYSFSAATGDNDVYDEYADEYDKYSDDFDDLYDNEIDNEYTLDTDSASVRLVDSRQDSTVKTQVQWIRNEFGHGVFVGKVPRASDGVGGGESAIVSSRLRSRDGEADEGIDLGGFGGFVCRVCSDGGTYEAFIRTVAFEKEGIEYVCSFSTASKAPRRGNASRNKFATIRLPFDSFKPAKKRTIRNGSEEISIPQFQGKDCRFIGFRFRSSSNPGAIRAKGKESKLCSFYLGLSYIKLFRTQPEPEFVYLSDARIPPVVQPGQVRHDLHQLISGESSSPDDGRVLLNDKALQQISSDKSARSVEETYYKYRGEEVLKNSGLSYAIVRVSGYNESPSSEASTISLKSTDDDIQPISRREAAEVCVSALLDPAALNKSFYVSKRKGQNVAGVEETMSQKFQSLRPDFR